MFNEEQKTRYIVEKQSLASVPEYFLERQFNKIESTERQLGKDACNFSTYEILEYYKNLNMTSLDSLNVLHGHLGMYTQWCLLRNLVDDCQNHYAEIKIDALHECINKVMFDLSFVTKEKLDRWIKETINPCDAFAMLALFEGIKGKDFCEIISIKMSDFKGNKLTLCTGKEIEISDKLISLAEECNETYELFSLNNMETKPKPLIETGCVIKAYCNVEPDATMFRKGRRIYNRIAKNLDYLGVKEQVSANDIFNSGKVYYINQRAKEKGIAAQELLYDLDFVKEMDQRFDTNFSMTKVPFIRKYKEYLV